MVQHNAIDHSGITGVGLSSGTAFPGGPSTNDLFYRTNILGGTLFKYDGTRWRSVDTRQITFGWSDAAVESGVGGTANAGRAAVPWVGTYGIFLLTMHVFWVPLATNNGSHFMTLKLNRADTADSDTQIGSTLSSVADTQDTNIYKSITIDAVLDSSARCLKARTDVGAGTPGGIIFNAHIDYQLIAT